MAKMKTFLIYLLILVGFWILSSFLINAYIKTSYTKINDYDIEVEDATITVMTARASKEDGYIKGKISNDSESDITNKYMVVELYSDSDVLLGTEYVKIDNLAAGKIKDFSVKFKTDGVKSFKIMEITEEEKNQIDSEKDTELFHYDDNVENVIEGISPSI